MERTYVVEIDDREVLVRIADGPDGLRVRVDHGPEESLSFALAQAPDLYSLLVNGISKQVRIAPDAEEPGSWQVTIDHHQLTACVQTERERRLSRVTGAKHHTGEVLVKAPMPGLVRAVSVMAGDQVQAGQRLVVLEAMKMENDIPAPRAGTVKTVRVVAGDTVELGRPLVVLE
jgi:biotin carboxyl carrier protein